MMRRDLVFSLEKTSGSKEHDCTDLEMMGGLEDEGWKEELEEDGWELGR